MQYTCGKCGKPVFAEPPKGDTSASQLQATALYCRKCNEIVCIECGIQKMSGGGGCPCGICGGPARTIDSNNHPSWYPGSRPDKMPNPSTPISTSSSSSIPSGPSDEPGNGAMTAPSRAEAGVALATPHCCWFCKTAVKEDASVQVALHGNIKWKFKQIPSGYGKLVNQHGVENVIKTIREKFSQPVAEETMGDVLACTWDEVSVTLPRCIICRTIHETVSAAASKVISVSMLTGAGIGLGIGVALWVFSSSPLPFQQGLVLVLVSAVVISVLSGIVGSRINKARKERLHRGVLFENDYAAFPPIQEKLANGWKLGAKPGNLEAWNWGIK